MKIETVIIKYAVISPAVLARKIEKAFDCVAIWRDFDEDSFEFTMVGCTDLEKLYNVLSKYM